MTKIRRLDGKLVSAKYVKHLRTMTGGTGRPNVDADLFRLTRTGELIVCESPDDSRATPQEAEGWDNTLAEIREMEAART